MNLHIQHDLPYIAKSKSVPTYQAQAKVCIPKVSNFDVFHIAKFLTSSTLEPTPTNSIRDASITLLLAVN